MSSNATIMSAAPVGSVDVFHGDDAVPIVRLVARTLRDAARDAECCRLLAGLDGVVALRSHDTPQAATVRFRRGDIEVVSGTAEGSDLILTVVLRDRFALVASEGREEMMTAHVLRVLAPPLPSWQQAAAKFWEVTRHELGMPEQLTAICEDADGVEELTLGEGGASYAIAGTAEALARVFNGTDDLLTGVLAGTIKVRGTLPQLSVMVGASWKVQFDV